jgi:hypothetical protein
MKHLLAAAFVAAIAGPALADDHVIIEHATAIGVGITVNAAAPSIIAGELTQKVVIAPVTTGPKGSQTPVMVPGLCPGQADVISVRSSNTGSATAGSASANVQLGQNDEIGLPAQLDAIASAQLAAGSSYNVVAALRDCTKVGAYAAH